MEQIQSFVSLPHLVKRERVYLSGELVIEKAEESKQILDAALLHFQHHRHFEEAWLDDNVENPFGRLLSKICKVNSLVDDLKSRGQDGSKQKSQDLGSEKKSLSTISKEMKRPKGAKGEGRFKCDFQGCGRQFHQEGWLKNHVSGLGSVGRLREPSNSLLCFLYLHLSSVSCMIRSLTFLFVRNATNDSVRLAR